MNETYQNRITDQICKIQNDRALIAFYDRLRYAPLGNYAQLHAKGEYQENGHKVHSLMSVLYFYFVHYFGMVFCMFASA